MKRAGALATALILQFVASNALSADEAAERQSLAKAIVDVSTIASMKASQARGLKRGMQASLGARATPYAISEANIALDSLLGKAFANVPERLAAAYSRQLSLDELRDIRRFQTDPVSLKLKPVLPAIKATDSAAEKLRLLDSVLNREEQERLALMANAPANDKLIRVTQEVATTMATSVDGDTVMKALRTRCPGKKERLPWC